MKKARARDIGAEILDGLRQLKRGEMGRVLTVPPVAARARVGLSQAEFARLLGVSVASLAGVEQGRRVPSGPGAHTLGHCSQEPSRAARRGLSVECLLLTALVSRLWRQE